MLFALFVMTLLVGMFIGVTIAVAASIRLDTQLTLIRPRPYPGAPIMHDEFCADPFNCSHTQAIPVQK